MICLSTPIRQDPAKMKLCFENSFNEQQCDLEKVDLDSNFVDILPPNSNSYSKWMFKICENFVYFFEISFSNPTSIVKSLDIKYCE